MDDGLERKETRVMKLIQEAVIYEPSPHFSLFMIKISGPVLLTLDKVMVNTVCVLWLLWI